MRQITGFCLSATDCPFPFVEKDIQVIDQRLHFSRILSADLASSSLPNIGKSGAQLIEFRQCLADLPQPPEHKCSRHASKRQNVKEHESSRSTSRMHAVEICNRQ